MSKLRKVLKERDLTQDEFARKIGVTQPFISRVIAGRAGLPPERALLAEQECGIPCEDLCPWLADVKLLGVKQFIAGLKTDG
jgi:transcriptional regulator with XRE-family HTH domain